MAEISEVATELTREEVFDILKFARDYAGASNALTPMLVNQRMQDVALNPLAATASNVASALSSPKSNESNLQGYSEDLELQSMVYKRLLDYCSNILAFDITYNCINADMDDYKSSKYKKDLKMVEEFLDKFDFKREFSVIVKEMLRNETFFGLPRFDSRSYVIQEFPSSPNWTMITGRSSVGGFLWSANMYWFIQPGTDLNMYPDFFKRKYNELWNENKQYKPSLAGDMRGNSSWVYWQDIPIDVGWAWKMNPEIATRIPYFSPLMLDLVEQGAIRNLQKSIYMAAAARMLIGEVPLLNKEAKATVKDSLAISPDIMAKFLALVKAGLGEAVKVASAPLEDMKQISFESENIYEPFLKTALATSGINTNLIFSSNIKPNAIETQLSLEVDSNIMMRLYPQFNSFLNYYANKFTSKYKFNFHFEGTNFFTNRNERFERVNALADKGIVLPQKFAAAIGMKPSDFQRQMEEAKAMGWVDSLTPIVSGFNMKQDGSKDEGGRPKKSSEDLGDAGQQTRDSAANVGRGGKE